MNYQNFTLNKWLPYDYPKMANRNALRLFCLPYAGGTVRTYREWINHAPAGIKVLPIQLPGREKRILETPFVRMGALVDTLIDLLAPEFAQGPFALFGHSMGGKIAFELARTLEQETKFQPTQLFVSGIGAPQLNERLPQVHHLNDAALIDELRRVNGTPEEILSNRELMEVVLPFIRADYTISETWRYQPGEPLRCPLTVFGGTEDPDANLHELLAWRELTRAEFDCKVFPGDHFFINHQGRLLMREIERVLERFAIAV